MSRNFLKNCPCTKPSFSRKPPRYISVKKLSQDVLKKESFPEAEENVLNKGKADLLLLLWDTKSVRQQ